MSTLPKVFFDSDVIISALISDRGAAYLTTRDSRLERLVSDEIYAECKKVVGRLALAQAALTQLVKKLTLKKTSAKYQPPDYLKYVIDPGDVHVIAGANLTKSKILVTYSQKDFRAELITQALGILLMTPGQLLQYLRSQIRA